MIDGAPVDNLIYIQNPQMHIYTYIDKHFNARVNCCIGNVYH